jgi:hypothetical protein
VQFKLAELFTDLTMRDSGFAVGMQKAEMSAARTSLAMGSVAPASRRVSQDMANLAPQVQESGQAMYTLAYATTLAGKQMGKAFDMETAMMIQTFAMTLRILKKEVGAYSALAPGTQAATLGLGTSAQAAGGMILAGGGAAAVGWTALLGPIALVVSGIMLLIALGSKLAGLWSTAKEEEKLSEALDKQREAAEACRKSLQDLEYAYTRAMAIGSGPAGEKLVELQIERARRDEAAKEALDKETAAKVDAAYADFEIHKDEKKKEEAIDAIYADKNKRLTEAEKKSQAIFEKEWGAYRQKEREEDLKKRQEYDDRLRDWDAEALLAKKAGRDRETAEIDVALGKQQDDIKRRYEGQDLSDPLAYAFRNEWEAALKAADEKKASLRKKWEAEDAESAKKLAMSRTEMGESLAYGPEDQENARHERTLRRISELYEVKRALTKEEEDEKKRLELMEATNHSNNLMRITMEAQERQRQQDEVRRKETEKERNYAQGLIDRWKKAHGQAVTFQGVNEIARQLIGAGGSRDPTTNELIKLAKQEQEAEIKANQKRDAIIVAIKEGGGTIPK